jgi:hypothetical protein
MKKITAIILTLCCFPGAWACDICGCGAGNNYIGILPDFYKHIVGVRYRYNQLRTHIGADGGNTYLTTSEKFNIAELWGGWTINGKYRVMFTLPYSFNEKINRGLVQKKNGLSDISLAGYYQVLNSKGAVLSDKLLVQSLWIGGGIKLPTGEYNPADKSNTNQTTNLFQLGTASVDYSLTAMYDIRLQDAGLNLSASCKFNTTNKYHYSYGNKYNLSAQFYYKVKLGQVTLAPNTGLQYERAAKDTDSNFDVDLSGGKLLLGTLGIESNFKKMAAGASWQTPLTQQLAGGFVHANNRFMLHLSVAL